MSAASVRLSQPRIAGAYAYWLESRPVENGRSVLVRARPGCELSDLTPPGFSVRSRVHEYGGGAFSVDDAALYFVNDDDQQIYVQTLDSGAVKPLSRAAGCRFADLLVDKWHARLIAVCEEHATRGATPRNTLVSISLRNGQVNTLAQGHDFYSSPAISPDGRQLAWLSWNAPLMPWDGCELWLAEFNSDATLASSRCVAGGADESLFQPQFAPDGLLYFVSDRSGYWNIYRYTDDKSHAITQDAMDYGFAQWNFGMSSYGFLADGAILATRIHEGVSELVKISAAGKTRTLDFGGTQIEHLHVSGADCVLLAGGSTRPQEVTLGSAGHFQALSATENIVPDEYLSEPEFMRFPTGDGAIAYAWYYPPHNPHHRVPRGEAPPLVVKCHGGPTAMSGNGLEPRIQFWTSRGFAVAEVNYRGSSGFGRDYRRSLYADWGIKDAEDCVAAARYLVERKLANPRQLAISGSSAGGFTVLCALARHDYFQAAAVYYGLSELETAMRDTHKFEAHYGEHLLGPWPEARDVYRSRSPLYAAERIHCPVIFFQGLKAKVLPPDQTERMLNALRANQLPVAYLSFAEEGHGFRRRETLQRALEAELAFYARIFGFTPADRLPPLAIENLSGTG